MATAISQCSPSPSTNVTSLASLSLLMDIWTTEISPRPSLLCACSVPGAFDTFFERQRGKNISQSYKTCFMLSGAYSFMNCKTILKSRYYRKIRSGSVPLSLKLTACTPPKQSQAPLRLSHQFWARPHSSKQIFHLPIQLQEHGGRGRSRGSTFSREKPVESQEADSLHYNISSV